MKRLITIIIIISTFNHGLAQTQERDPDQAVKKIDTTKMNLLVGTWQWKNGQDSFTLVLKIKNFTGGFKLLLGGYRYTKNGKTIVDQLDTSQKDPVQGFTGGAWKDKKEVPFIFVDVTRHNAKKEGFLYFINETFTKATFILNEGIGGHYVNHNKSAIYQGTIPSTMKIVLQKVNDINVKSK